MNKIRFLKTGIIAFVMCICAFGAGAVTNLEDLAEGYDNGYMLPGETYAPASDTYTRTADPNTPAHANAYYNILPGYYIPSVSSGATRVATTCPANSYCPGANDISLTENSSAIGITACNNGFTSSSGATSAYGCSKACTINDLLSTEFDGDERYSWYDQQYNFNSFVTGVTGRVYQNSYDTEDKYYNTCIATGCSTGYSLNEVDYSHMLADYWGGIWFMSGWNLNNRRYTGQDIWFNSSNSNGALVRETITTNERIPYMDAAETNGREGAWALAFVHNGNTYEYDGTSYCVDGNDDIISSQDSRLGSEYQILNIDTKSRCYCAMKQYIDHSTQTAIPILGDAVFLNDYDDYYNCRLSCPMICFEAVLEAQQPFLTKLKQQTMAMVMEHCTANRYVVSFNPNGGSGGQSANVTAVYNSTMPTINTTAPTKTGYTFAGWYDTDASSGGTQYYTPAGVSARTWNKTSDATLYARWENVVYTLTVNQNGGERENVNSALMGTITLYKGDRYLAIEGEKAHDWEVNGGVHVGESISTADFSTPVKKGYTFAGYYSALSDGTQYINANGVVQEAILGVSGNTTIYAHWTPKQITIVWGGVNSPYNETTVDYDGNIQTPASANVIKTTGQEFIGWKFVLPSGN